jgi:hypothetical protein
MSNKNSIEAFARFHRAKESLAELTQIGTAAMNLLKLNVSVGNGAALLGAFVDSCEVKHWGNGKTFPNPAEKTSQIGSMFCRHILVQQVSAFDLFSTTIISDFARFSNWARANLPELKHAHKLIILSPQKKWVASPCCNELADKCGDLKDRIIDLDKLIGWRPSPKLKNIIPLVDLARMARNRIVHSDSMVGSDLEAVAKGKATHNAFAYFQAHYSRGDVPALPKWERGMELKLAPENAIFFGAVLSEVAKEINAYVCSKLTDKEYVEMAFYYSCFVETHPGRTIRQRDIDGRIKNYLSSRYMFDSAVNIKTIYPYLKDPIVEKLGVSEERTTLWKIALQRHEVLAEYEKATLPPVGKKPPKKKTPKKTIPAKVTATKAYLSPDSTVPDV